MKKNPRILCQYPPVYSLKVNITGIIVLSLGFSVLKSTCAIVKYLPYQGTLLRTTWKKLLLHFDLYIEMNYYTNWTEWMKGICHIWSRGRHFSPSLPGDRYLKLGSKSDLRAEISGSIVGYEALAPRPEVLRSISSFYANNVFWLLFFDQAQVS